MLNFKDFTVVDYKPGTDQQIKYVTQKRKRGASDTSGVVEEVQSEDQLDEVLSIQQRMKKKADLRRNKAKVKLGARKAQRRLANKDVLARRARRRARMVILKKILRGKDKSDLSYGARGAYERMVNRRKAALKVLSRKLLPKVRAADRAKLQSSEK